MHFDSLNNLFVHELRDLYSAENQIVEALPKMVGAASSTDLKDAFSHHLEQSRRHLTRLNEIFAELNIAQNSEKCEGIEGIIREGQEILQAGGDPMTKDAALISAAQRVEHYEMAAYGSARTYAKVLGHDHAAKLLQETLDEEGDADHKLTKLAEGGLLSSGINKEAAT